MNHKPVSIQNTPDRKMPRRFVFILLVVTCTSITAKLPPPSTELVTCLSKCENPSVVWPKCQQVVECIDDCVNTSELILFSHQLKVLSCEPQCGEFHPKCSEIIKCLVSCMHPDEKYPTGTTNEYNLIIVVSILVFLFCFVYASTF